MLCNSNFILNDINIFNDNDRGGCTEGKIKQPASGRLGVRIPASREISKS